MDGNSSKKDESTSSSLLELLNKYTNRSNEISARDPTPTSRPQQKINNDEIGKSKDTVNKSQSKTSLLSDLQEDTSHINYKTKWEESEVKYQQLEKKYRQLETGTIKQLQDKIDKLQRESNQMKVIKDRINEICSCRQLTNNKFEQLKLLINNNISNEPIANKNDFHQQTIKLRSILLEHNDQLINKIDDIINKKRKRDQYEMDLINDDD